MKSITYIYALVDPITNEYRYVGKTLNPKTRLNSHIAEAKKLDGRNIKKAIWINTLVENGLKPLFIILDKADISKSECWEEKEKHWIKYGRDNGWNLCNISDGGIEAKVGKQYKQITTKKCRSKIPTNLLGTMPDWELAQKLGLKTNSVKGRRMALGIPPLEYREEYEWTDYSIALLGTMQDMNLARKLRVSTSLIKDKRNELGIPHYKTFDYENQKPRVVKNPRTTYNSVKEKDYHLLGTMTDQDLADKLGVHHATVQTRRRKLGIPSFRKNVVGKQRKERIESHKRKPSKYDVRQGFSLIARHEQGDG